MKQFIYVITALVISVTSINCTENLDVENDRVLQGTLNGDLYRNTDALVLIDDETGTVRIQGNSPVETLSLVLNSDGEGEYALGLNSDNAARYENKVDDIVYTTDNFFSLGEVIVDEIDGQGRYTGSFSFVAYSEDNRDSLFFRNGLFYQLPSRIASETFNPDGESMTASIDGNSFEASTIDGQTGGGQIVVSGTSGGTNITISFPSNATAGSYDIGMTQNLAVLVTSSGQELADMGSITITSNDTGAGRVIGSFNFTTQAGTAVTSGAFEAAY